MPKQDFRLAVVVRALDNETCLAEALFFPEVSRYAGNSACAADMVAANARQALENEALARLHSRVAPEKYDLTEVSVKIEPPKRTEMWREAVQLTFQIARWTQGPTMQVAFVPALGIEVIAPDAAELEKLLPQHIRAELVRSKATESLGRLLWTQRTQEIEVKELVVYPNLRTPKQITVEGEHEEEKSTLKEIATDLLTTKSEPVFECETDLLRLAEALTARRVRSVLLVGPSGVGKTALVRELARRRADFRLKETPFWAVSGAQLVAGQTGFGMWQERCQKLAHEAAKTKAVIHFGSLVELLETGKYEGNEQGLASFFRPSLARGDFIGIAECAPEQLAFIERAAPALLQVFQQITISEPAPARGREILKQYAAARAGKEPSLLSLQALDAIDRLHRRYATYSAFPGRPVRFLRNLLDNRPPRFIVENPGSIVANDEKALPIGEREVVSAFSAETGLPLLLLDDETPLDVTATQDWLAARVIGQDEAVQLVTDLIATVKAGLTRPRRPIASLLFIGPTGVGKTEMAKSLAEFFFRDRNRLLRFDMSEYADPLAVKRLIGGVTATEGQLTAKMREQPFAVVLFDEVEKADPSFFDLLLQLLGEGRLTDAGGRVADFSNAIVIMTSNLGAESYGRGIEGFVNTKTGQRAAKQHFTKAVRDAVRPELFNRIDRIAPFAPLGEKTVLRIAERELETLRQREGLRFRAVNLKMDKDLARHLARVGYHPRYGARPLKRALERELLVPLAESLNQHGSETPLDAAAQLSADNIAWQVQPHSKPKNWREAAQRNGLLNVAQAATDLRRRMQRLEHGATAQGLRNQIWRLEELERRQKAKARARGRALAPAVALQLENLPKLRHVIAQVEDTQQHIYTVEERALLQLYGQTHTPLSETQAETAVLEQDYAAARESFSELLYTLLAWQYDTPHRVMLGLFSEGLSFMYALARAYYAHAQACDYEVKCYQYTTKPVPKGELPLTKTPVPLLGREVTLQTIAAPDAWLTQENEGVAGVLLQCNGKIAFPRFIKEGGLHIFKDENERASRCLVLATNDEINQYEAPEWLAERGSVADGQARRIYNVAKGLIEDKDLKKNYPFKGADFTSALAAAVSEQLKKDAEALA